MNEAFWSPCKVIATVLWVLVVSLLVVAWSVVLWGHRWEVGVMFALSACALSAAAATMQIRSFMVQTCALVRALSGLSPPESASLRSIR